MKTISLEGQKRESAGKKAAKLLRKEGRVPCVMYGGSENISFSVKYNDLLKIVYTDEFLRVNIKVDGNSTDALLKDLDFHPVTDKIIHVDFQELVPGKMIKAQIPIHLIGRAKGVVEGGVLQQSMKKLNVKVLPEHLVMHIDVDVTNIEIGKSIKVGDIQSKMKIMNPAGNPIARVIVPRAMKSLMASEEATEEGEEGEEEVAAE